MNLTLEQLKQLIKEEVSRALKESQESSLDDIFGPTPADAPTHPTLGVIPQGSTVTAHVPRKGQSDFVFTGELRYPDETDVMDSSEPWASRDPKAPGNEWVILQDGEYGDYPCYLKRVVKIG